MMIMTLMVFLLLVLTTGSHGQDFNVTQTVPSGDDPVVAAVTGAENVGIFCEFIDSSSGELLRVRWRLFTSPSDTVGTPLVFNSTGHPNDEASQNFMTTSNNDSRRNLTIRNFLPDYDGASIECDRVQVGQRFDLRIIRLPSLNVNVTELVAESSTFSFNIESSSGFPLIPDTYQWSIGSDVIPLDSVNPNISAYPNITFTSVSRNDSGNYSISVTNEAGTTNGYFILDVQFGPEGDANTEGTRYVLMGTASVTIIGYSSFNGNPSPSSSWSLDGSSVVSGGRFNTDTIGQLSISSVQLSDTGNYTNTLMNTVAGQGMSITNTIELIVAEGPSKPRDVTVLNTGADYVNISWVNPMNTGTVPLDQYTVTIESSTAPTVSQTVTDVNTNDPDYVNTLIVSGLQPITLYTVTVHANSTVPQVGDIMGDTSDPVSFNTTLGAPQFSSALLVSSNGNLSVSWEFLHTGGGALSSITVQCFSTADDEDEMLPASAAPLATIINCMDSVQCDNSTEIGPVTTGANYSCIVTAENSIGMEDEIRTNYVIADTGLPSEAVVTDVEGGARSATITVRVDNYGVTDPNQFFFTVVVYANGVEVDRREGISPDSIDSPTNVLTIDNLPVGMLSFLVTASNIYGSPMNANNVTTSIVPISEIMSTTTQSTSIGSSTPTRVSTSTTSVPAMTRPTSGITTSVSPTRTNTEPTRENVSGLSGGAIAGIVIAVIILIAIVALVIFIVVYLVYQSKGDSYKVEGGKVVVEEHDIDIGTELQQTKPVQQSPEKQPLDQPRQELQYADLADFAPSKRAAHQAPPTSSTKPMPIEEVQYAVIRPQDQKKGPPTDSADDNL